MDRAKNPYADPKTHVHLPCGCVNDPKGRPMSKCPDHRITANA